MSSESNKRYKLFLNRSQHQLKEVEFNCREVISLSQQLNLMVGDVQATEVNSRKIEFMKGEIKDKLREYASYIDQIYKILDRKLMLLMREVDRESKAVEKMEGKEGSFRKGSEEVYQSMNRVGQMDKDTQKTHEKSNPSYEQDRFFTDTLNPRVMQLEAKLTQYEQNEATQNHKITELKVKNQKLLQEFTRLSTASNRKINQLSSEIHNITGRDKDSFSSADSGSGNPRQPTHRDNHRPFLLLEDKHQSLNQSPYKQKQKQKQRQQEELSSNRRKQVDGSGDNRPFTFGCMPISHQNQQNYDGASFNRNVEGYERMDKEDKHRRFDLLLNKLRYGEKEKEKEGRPVESSGETVKNMETPQKKSDKSEGEEYTSVFANDLVKRYQV